MGPGIGVDPSTVRNVAGQCQRMQTNLMDQVNNFTTQLHQLETSLQGPAADAFKAQFQKWQQMVRQMSETMGTTNKTLNQIADSADQQIAALRRLGGQ